MKHAKVLAFWGLRKEDGGGQNEDSSAIVTPASLAPCRDLVDDNAVPLTQPIRNIQNRSYILSKIVTLPNCQAASLAVSDLCNFKPHKDQRALNVLSLIFPKFSHPPAQESTILIRASLAANLVVGGSYCSQ